MPGSWAWLVSGMLVAAGSCSVDTDYAFDDGKAPADGEGGGLATGGRAPASGDRGGASGTTGVSCSNEPCKNGGTCHQGATGFACGCLSGFSGPTCEEAGNGGRANGTGGQKSTGGAVTVTGESGGTTSSGGNSQGTGGFDHPCFPNPCLNNGYCELDGVDYLCNCNGYEGPLCEDDIDECAETPGPCLAGETCRNYPGNFGCPCPAGFTGEDCDLPRLEWFTLPEGWRACVPRGVSADGVVVVGYCSVTPTGSRAFRWTHAEGISLIGALGAESAAAAVSSDGKVIVGSYVDDSDAHHLFRWTSATGMRPETGLDAENGSEGYDVNADGSVVVGISYPGAAFRWTESERLNLGTLNPGGAAAWGVSGDGAIVVGESEGTAFRWTAATGIQPLSAPPGGGEYAAKAISADGLIIAGYGSSGTEGWGLVWRAGSVQVIPRFDSQVSAVSNTGIVLSASVVWNGQLRTPEQALQDAGIELDRNVTSIGALSPDGRYFVGYGAGGAYIARAPDAT